MGLVSDTHDNLPLTREAAALFHRMGVRLVIHCGDVTEPGTVEPLAGFDLVVVEGNNDEDPALADAVEAADGFYGDAWTGEVGDAPAIALHGHKRGITRRAIASGAYRYAFVGHSHRPGVERVGPTLVVNPGALWRTRVRTVATLDPIGGKVRFYRVTEAGCEALPHAPETGYRGGGGNR